MNRQTPKRTGGNQATFLLIFGVIWLAFSLIFLMLAISDESGGGIFFLSIFVLIGAGLTLYGLWLAIMRLRVGKPAVTFSNTTLHVGEPFTIHYEHTLRSGLTVEQLVFELIFREIATYQQGTDTRTVTQNHVMDAYERPGGQFNAGHTLLENVSLTIPADAMHTLDVRRNKLRWIVKMTLTLSDMPDYVDEYEVIVTPTVWKRP